MIEIVQSFYPSTMLTTKVTLNNNNNNDNKSDNLNEDDICIEEVNENVFGSPTVDVKVVVIVIIIIVIFLLKLIHTK